MQHFFGDVNVLFKLSQELSQVIPHQTRSSVAQALDLKDTHVHHPYSFHLQVTASDQLMTGKSLYLNTCRTELMPTHNPSTSHALVIQNPPYNFCKNERKQQSLRGACNWSTQHCLSIEWCLSLMPCLLLTCWWASRGGAGTWQQRGGKRCFLPAIALTRHNLVLYMWQFSYM